MKNSGDVSDLFDETRLRRALRLDASEAPPRLDAQAIAALAQARVPFAPATLVSAMVAGVSAAILVATGAIAFSVLAPTLLAEGLAGAIALAARIAVPMDGVIRQLQEPTMPIAAIAGLAMAIAYEFRQRRERLHVLSST